MSDYHDSEQILECKRYGLIDGGVRLNQNPTEVKFFEIWVHRQNHGEHAAEKGLLINSLEAIRILSPAVK